MSEKTLSATRTVKDVIVQYNGVITKIPVTSGLFKAYRNAHKATKKTSKNRAATTAAAASLLGKRKAATEELTEQLATKKDSLR